MSYWKPEGYYQLGQGKYADTAVDDVLSRLKVATGTKTQVELANWLGVRQSQVSDVRRRNIIPARWLYLLLKRQTNYNPVWVLTGCGESYTEERAYTVAGLRGVIPVTNGAIYH